MENYMHEHKGALRIQSPICDRMTVTDLSADFSLPDYQPEIKRLLRVRATVLHPDTYIGAGSAELTGTVEYSILYTGNDGAIYCASETGEYQISVPIEADANVEWNAGVVCDAEILPESVTGRVAAPRKFAVKARLRSHVQILGTCVLAEELVASGEREDLQRLWGSAECAERFVGVGEAMELGDEILCDSQADDLRVISAEGQVFVTEAVSGSGTVNCRGELCLKLLTCREGGETAPAVLWRRIPFSQVVPVEGAEVNCDACADGICSGVRVRVEEGRILCEATVRLRAHAQRNVELRYVRDLYSTTSECRTKSETLALPQALGCFNGNFSLNGSLPFAEAGIKQASAVADLSVMPTVTALEAENGKYYLCGRCRCQAILLDGTDTVLSEFELPFRYETDGGAAVHGYDATVEAISCRAKVDGERIGVDAELAVSLCVRGEQEIQLLTEAALGDAVERAGAVYTICYPSREDTLWSVAKRYRRSVSEISESNSLGGAQAADSPESLAGVGYLVV